MPEAMLFDASSEKLCGNPGMKGLGNIPCENPSGEVVYHRVEVSPTAIEQPDQRRVDMPDLVRA